MTTHYQTRKRKEPFFRIGELHLNLKNIARKILLGNNELKDFEIIYHEKHGRTTSFDIFVFALNTRKYSEFDKLDLTDDLRSFYWEEVVFNGHVENMIFHESFAIFECRGFEREFSSSKVGIEWKNFDEREEASELFYTLARKFWTPEHMYVEKAKLHEREFLVVVSIVGLINNNNEILISNVHLNCHFSKDVSEILYSCQYIDHEDWNDRNSRARVIVKSTNYYDAMQEGYQRVKRIIELITLKNDIGFNSYILTSKSSFYDRIHSSYIRPSPIVFCKEHNSSRAMFMDLASSNGFDLYSADINEEFLESIRPLEGIITKDPNSLSKIERTLLNSLQWLRISFEFTDLNLKVMALTNSLEFVIKETKVKHKFTANEVFLIKEIVDNIVRRLKLSEQQVEIIGKKLDGLNDAPVLARVKEFLTENHIPFDTYEMEIIRKLRKNRNKLQHGVSGFVIDKKELRKLRTLIERILIIRLNKLNKK